MTTTIESGICASDTNKVEVSMNDMSEERIYLLEKRMKEFLKSVGRAL